MPWRRTATKNLSTLKFRSPNSVSALNLFGPGNWSRIRVPLAIPVGTSYNKEERVPRGKKMKLNVSFLSLLFAVLTWPNPTTPFASSKRNKFISFKQGRYVVQNLPEPKLQQQLRPGGVAEKTLLLVDYNNVRGKTGFRETSAGFLARINAWAKAVPGAGRVVVVIDHGLEPCATIFRDGSLITAFAGPNRTADDVIANAAQYIANKGGLNVLVVTSDRELSARCTSWQGQRKRKRPQYSESDISLKMGRVHVVASATLLSMLDWSQQLAIDTTVLFDEQLEAVHMTEASLRHFENHRDTRYFRRNRKSIINADNIADDSNDAEGILLKKLTGLVPKEIAAALTPMPFSERTWHRVLSAERLRRALLIGGKSNCDMVPSILSAWVKTLNEGIPLNSQNISRNPQHKACTPSFHDILRDHRLRHDENQRRRLQEFIIADAELREGKIRNEKNHNENEGEKLEAEFDKYTVNNHTPLTEEKIYSVFRGKGLSRRKARRHLKRQKAKQGGYDSGVEKKSSRYYGRRGSRKSTVVMASPAQIETWLDLGLSQ